MAPTSHQAIASATAGRPSEPMRWSVKRQTDPLPSATNRAMATVWAQPPTKKNSGMTCSSHVARNRPDVKPMGFDVCGPVGLPQHHREHPVPEHDHDEAGGPDEVDEGIAALVSGTVRCSGTSYHLPVGPVSAGDATAGAGAGATAGSPEWSGGAAAQLTARPTSLRTASSSAPSATSAPMRSSRSAARRSSTSVVTVVPGLANEPGGDTEVTARGRGRPPR